ncbi:BatD family protein [Neptunomonas japonica]|uniref:BatD family protein n=1 Tax=Neptunomonas japonica TaxID=417574 RepID=UPI00040F03EE|nr:BatD family protein [Neptunomonas japonica]
MVSARRVWLIIVLLCVSVNLHAAIKSSINRSMIEQGESIRLSIDLEDVDADQVGLKPLEKDFEVLGRSQQSKRVIRNGSYESSSELILTLLPKRSGDLQVPSLRADGDQTSSHALRVTAVQQPAAADGGIEMLSTLSSEQPRVQQPLIYQTSLLVGRQIFNASLQGPSIQQGKALIEPLGEQRQYQQALKGRQVTVVEQTWLITPEQSGPLEIAPAQVIGQIQTGRLTRNPFGGAFSDPTAMRRVQVSAQGYQLGVAPIPGSFSGQVWLPAENLVLSDEWSSEQFTVGEPVTRTIRLKAEGLSRNHISELPLPEIDGIKQYAANPEVAQQYENDRLTAVLTLEVTLIPEKSGALTLPAITLPWWDVQSDSEQTAVLAARIVDIAPGKAQAAKPTRPSQAAPVQALSQAPVTAIIPPLAKPTTPQSTGGATDNDNVSPWLVALLGLIVGSVITALVMIFWQRSRNSSTNTTENTMPLPPPSVTALKQACSNNDATQARLALIQWGQSLWPECSNLNQLSVRVSPELQAAIRDLQQNSYGQSATSPVAQKWQGTELYKAVQAFSVPQSSIAVNTEKLSPLYLS